jgi:hypothetical protein
MGKQLIARGQVSVNRQDDLYLINQTVSEYIFSAENDGTISKAVSFTSTVKIMQGDVLVTNFNIGAITKPAGFSAITVNNTNKTISYSITANTTTLADTGIISIPITINNETYYASFVWSKAKSGASGSSGQDGYTLNLSRKNYVVSTDKDGKIHADVTTSTVITALKGATAITPVIGTLPTVSGCTLTKSGTTVTIVFKTGTALAESGVIDIPVTVDGKSFVVSFAYAKAKTGATGPAGVDANLLDWVSDWNSNKTVIDSYSVITPKIFAGVKNSNGTISGIAIGKFSLSTINASGQVASEIVNGIYGFKDGYKTFFIDHAGNVQIGNNNQSINYNSSTGKIEFGSEVSLNWTNAANNALASAKSYADTKKTEAISAAAIDATTKSNNAKNDAIATAATDATNKVNAIKGSIAEAKKAGTDAQAVADAITKKANDEKWATKMTYIDASGIFTGTLSANTVNAIKINASQITAGTIDVARLNVSALKSELITAANIDALTLNVTKGKIGGWTIDSDSIFRGTKNNTAGAFTGASGSITIGSNGIRGFKWRFDATGAGSLAGGNIAWDASGNVTFGSSVSLNWTNAANNALTSAKSYADTKKTEAINAAATDATTKANQAKTDAINSASSDATVKSDAAKELARAMAFGRMLYRVPEFYLNNAIHYNGTNNYACGNAVRSIEKVEGCPNSTGYALKYVATNWNSTTDKRIGGFFFANPSRHNAIFIARIVAFIPVGRSIQNYHNSYGTGGTTKWLTSQAGTGKWEEYICKVTCGSTGTFSTINHFALTGGADPSAESPVTWYIGYVTIFDVSSSEKYTTTIDANGIYTGTLTAGQVNAVSIDAGSIKTGTLSADRIASGSIKAVKLDAASIKSDIINVGYINGLSCTFIQGKIGGWTIGNDNISIGSLNVIGQTPIQIRSVSSGSGYIYSGQFKPLGITLSWYQSSNAGHLVFGQIMATGNTIKTGFLGIQMMAWDSTEYFCLSTNITKSGAKEIYNRIAGWDFDNDSIYRGTKNNTAGGNTSASGGITIGSNGIRGFKWRLDSTGTGAIAGGNISWDAAGNVSFASSVSLNWTTPISKIETALGGSSYPKLTKVDANGIYTGTLTASQINVTGIDASKITVGTLSVDRLAAGSITAAKLNVANVQASVVTAAAVNGLTCTFVRGTIGGWNIASDNISIGSLGATGTVPIQLRAASSGSGYWYTGAYKPMGLTMTWHQSSNAGHIVFGQIAASGSTIRSGFVGIQMMAWDNTEYFCLSANYTLSGSKEVYNRIAGWAFDNDSIYRGTKSNTSGAYTSASGSITIGSNGIRGYKWRLDSTGAGAIAGGNISWDASGNVSFAASVSLNWTNAANTAADGAKELALAMAFGKMLYRDPTFINGNNGISVYNNSGNGTVTITRASDSLAPNDNKMVLIIQNKGTSSPYCGGFTFGTGTSARRVLIARIVAKIPVGRSISYHSNSIGTGGSQKWLTSVAGTGDWAEYICKITGGTSGTFSSTCYFALTGDIGTASVPVEWRVAYATVFDQASNERFMTTIDANGIYTGTVKANQILVDSALVVGGSSYNGSISVRDASNVVKVILDRNGITAVGGTIGGWVIASTQISKNGIILGADGSITNGTKWKLNYDGSGQFANGNITWNTSGSVTMTGTINATAGNIGGFEIGSGRIGSSASATGSGGGLAIYNDFFRVGSSISYAMLGDDTFPASAGGSFKTTARITNTRYDSWFTNIGIYLDVKNAKSNYGIHSNAAIMGPALISNKVKVMSFGSGSYTIDFSQHNIFFIYATTTCSVTLPSESSVCSMFGLSSLPSDFACVVTFIYNYNYGNRITFNNLRNFNGGTGNYAMEKGDILTILCAKFPAFHYQVINHHS